MGLEQEIKDKGRELGFDAVGITDASPIGREHAEPLEEWLRRGYAGPMDYMHRNLEKRIDPARLRKGAQSVIVVALNYKIAESTPQDEMVGIAHPTSPQSAIRNPESTMGKVAAYAQYEDYHPFMKSLLRELASFVSVRVGRPDRYKICVDSTPLIEKALAVRAGLGFVGRNHLLIHPQLGPQVLLGELVTTVPIQPDEPAGGTCHDCDRCIKACPTGALRPDGFLDARRCISCLTQYPSKEGPAPDTHGWLFGCDECLRACPFHDQAPPRANRQFKFHPDGASLDLPEVLGWDAQTFDSRFADSPIHRLGLVRLQQTAQACLAGT
ncbi:MAG: tRNA epoxyqueuosine(34) reductase QueG [Sedimentisphaerales bacterium]|nr:tRNA epoxyqueuosine(34) reductase QueG [Sedimentisphaerales bacterium]